MATESAHSSFYMARSFEFRQVVLACIGALMLSPTVVLSQVGRTADQSRAASAEDQSGADATHRTLLVRTRRGSTAGLPIHWDKEAAVVLRPSGVMDFFKQSEITKLAKLDTVFRPESALEAQSSLRAELGQGFEVLQSGHYVVAASKGNAVRWRRRFSKLYSGFVRYFSLRGWQIREPDFPLRVIVFRTQSEFEAFARSQQSVLPAGAIGAYFAKTNVCALYELPSLSDNQRIDWSETEATIVHEAVHQLAYNTGVHERLFEHPLWFVEGLATMFESPNTYDPQSPDGRSSEFERRQLHTLDRVLQSDEATANLLGSLIASDKLFQQDPQIAYAGSWALTKFLAQQMPKQYRKVTELQQRRGYGEYTSRQRIEDFHAAVGLPPALLAKRIRMYLDQD